MSTTRRWLLAAGAADRHAPVAELAPEQINVGPGQLDRDCAGLVFSRFAPRGNYDLAALIRSLPPDQRPDVTACALDGASCSWPVNLASCPGVKVLLLGEVATGPDGGAALAAYLQREKFDRVVMTGGGAGRDRLHSAGIEYVHWLPGVLCPVSDRLARLVRQRERQDFIAAAPPDWRRRTALNQALGALHRLGRTASYWAADFEERMEHLGHAATALLPGEQGAWSPELFEALAAGTVVIGGKREWSAGGLAEPPPWIEAESPEAQAEMAAHYCEHPDEAAAKRQATADWFDAHLSETRRREALAKLIDAPDALPGWRKTTAVYFPPLETPDEAGLQLRRAREWLESAEPEKAWQTAQPLLSHPGVFADALVIAADAALELGREEAWTACRALLQRLDAHDPRLRHLEVRHAHRIRLHARRLLESGWRMIEREEPARAQSLAERMIESYPRVTKARGLRAWAQHRHAGAAVALAAWQDAVGNDPNRADLWFDLAVMQFNAGEIEAGADALARVLSLRPEHGAARRLQVAMAALRGEVTVSPGPERDLLITMPETNRRHGTGVLLRRFFPDSRDFITLRSFTNYQGVEEFGGLNLLVGAAGLNATERAARLRRLLEPFRIRRILCVPFAPVDFHHAVMVREFTGAPLATYVMDDQNLTVGKVPDEDVRRLFAASGLRLTISPEMQAGYAARYGCAVDLMPPIVTDRAARRENRWSPRVRPANHVALVGNVWSDMQLKQVARFVVQAGLRVDWFGREAHPVLTKAGLHGRGFWPEPKLADELTTYPYVLVPSGALDGTEDNEWLTRLSLPSRLVFLLQTQTPMLVLGSPLTAAASFVQSLGLGLVLPYYATDSRKALRELTQPDSRTQYLERAAAGADGFVMPAAGEWIWQSLAAGRALPAPFDAVYAAAETPSLAMAG